MSDNRLMGMSAIRARMVTASLLVAVAAGFVMLAMGGGASAVAVVAAAALLSALLCTLFLGNAVAGIRAEQTSVVEYLQPSGDLSDIRAELDDIRAIAASNSVIIDTIRGRRRERRQLLDQVVAAEEQLKLIMHRLQTGDEDEVVQVRDAVAAMESMNSAFSLVIIELDELSGRAEDRAAISGQMSATTDAIAENINQYSGFVVEASNSIEEMARAINETAENIRGLALSTEQTVTSINQISASQANVRDNAEQSAAASENVRNQARQGLHSMTATLRAMQEIEKSNDESFESINRLSRHSARVGEFLSVIRDVVEQTRLLSLNASIIAAQAGERGRAFAVVAEEVRSLAHRTSASTKEIEELVRNIQKETAAVQRSVTQGKGKVKEGVKISSLTNEALVKIERSAEDASQMGARIAGETTEQTAGIQRITEEAEKNLERVRQITLNTAQQQEGTSLIVNNLMQLRELAQRINLSAQEQARGNRLYLKSVMEDNERTQQLKTEAAQQIAVARQAVDAVRQVEALITANAAESRKILDGTRQLTLLIDRYRGEIVSGPVEEAQ